MKYKLPSQICDPNIYGIISREIKKQKIGVLRVSSKDLEEIATISRSIESLGIPDNLVMKKLPQGLGYGIFLHPGAKPIPRGSVIAPYSGEVLLVPQRQDDGSAYVFEMIANISLTKQEQQVFSKKLPFHPRRRYAINLDALKKGNFTRFINHSEKPNVVAHLVRIPANKWGLAPAPLQIVYFADKTIYPGEQLLVCYEDGGKSYWNPLGIKPLPVTPKTFQINRALELVNRGFKD